MKNHVICLQPAVANDPFTMNRAQVLLSHAELSELSELRIPTQIVSKLSEVRIRAQILSKLRMFMYLNAVSFDAVAGKPVFASEQGVFPRIICQRYATV